MPSNRNRNRFPSWRIERRAARKHALSLKGAFLATV